MHVDAYLYIQSEAMKQIIEFIHKPVQRGTSTSNDSVIVFGHAQYPIASSLAAR